MLQIPYKQQQPVFVPGLAGARCGTTSRVPRERDSRQGRMAVLRGIFLRVRAEVYVCFFFRDDLREEEAAVRLLLGLLGELKNSILACWIDSSIQRSMSFRKVL